MLNKTMLIGNLGADVDTRYTKTKVAVASFRVATTERWKDNQGNPQEATEWHRIVAFGRLAEICSEYLAKGSRVYLEGRLQTRKWEDDKGNTRFHHGNHCSRDEDAWRWRQGRDSGSTGRRQ